MVIRPNYPSERNARLPFERMSFDTQMAPPGHTRLVSFWLCLVLPLDTGAWHPHRGSVLSGEAIHGLTAGRRALCTSKEQSCRTNRGQEAQAHAVELRHGTLESDPTQWNEGSVF